MFRFIRTILLMLVLNQFLILGQEIISDDPAPERMVSMNEEDESNIKPVEFENYYQRVERYLFTQMNGKFIPLSNKIDIATHTFELKNLPHTLVCYDNKNSNKKFGIV